MDHSDKVMRTREQVLSFLERHEENDVLGSPLSTELAPLLVGAVPCRACVARRMRDAWSELDLLRAKRLTANEVRLSMRFAAWAWLLEDDSDAEAIISQVVGGGMIFDLKAVRRAVDRFGRMWGLVSRKRRPAVSTEQLQETAPAAAYFEPRERVTPMWAVYDHVDAPGRVIFHVRKCYVGKAVILHSAQYEPFETVDDVRKAMTAAGRRCVPRVSAGVPAGHDPHFVEAWL